MIDRQDSEQSDGTLIGRRRLLTMAIAAGALAPFIGGGTAHASTDDWYPIPEESGSVPWW